MDTASSKNTPATMPTENNGSRGILEFKKMSIADIPVVAPILAANPTGSRTCDFTIGGMFMWIDYFGYEMCIADDTLFLRGLNEKDLTTEALSVPCGRLPLEESLKRLRDYCRATHTVCTLSAVPEKLIAEIGVRMPIESIDPLDDWADYLYDIQQLASLSGKKLNKKRNHVNRFMADNPSWHYERLTAENLPAVENFFCGQHLAPDKSVTADFERLQVLEVLRHPTQFGFKGGVLSVDGRGIVAFAMGETVADTLYVHIEKMDHEVVGAGETINKLFAADMLESDPGLKYVNREEDTGDEGLRQAKLSYHPAEILHKFNVTLK